jgi:hypothetical protein
VPFGIIYAFEFDHFHVLKIKTKAKCCGDMLLPQAVENEQGNAYSAGANRMSCLDHRC